MNEGNEAINWKGYIDNPIIQTYIFIFMNLLFLGFFHKYTTFTVIKNYLNYEITVTVPDIIAILTIFVLAIGVLYYAGANYRVRETYHLKSLVLSFKNQLLIIGATFLFSILLSIIFYILILQRSPDNYWNSLIIFLLMILIAMYLIINYFENKLPIKKLVNINNFESKITIFTVLFIIYAIFIFISSQQSILYYAIYYVVVIALLLILFGYKAEKNRYKNNNVILEMIDSLDPIKDLELFDITDNDYRFKKMDGTELIVPIGQVRKIIYNNTE